MGQQDLIFAHILGFVIFLIFGFFWKRSSLKKTFSEEGIFERELIERSGEVVFDGEIRPEKWLGAKNEKEGTKKTTPRTGGLCFEYALGKEIRNGKGLFLGTSPKKIAAENTRDECNRKYPKRLQDSFYPNIHTKQLWMNSPEKVKQMTENLYKIMFPQTPQKPVPICTNPDLMQIRKPSGEVEIRKKGVFVYEIQVKGKPTAVVEFDDNKDSYWFPIDEIEVIL